MFFFIQKAKNNKKNKKIIINNKDNDVNFSMILISATPFSSLKI